MALIKTLEIGNTGVSGEYICIQSMNIDSATMSANIITEVYLSKQAKLDGKEPIGVHSFFLQDASKIQALLSEAYISLLNDPKLDGARVDIA